MEQNEYSELPVNLRKQIFELYTGARNPNYSPDFNSGFIHALETLFGYNNCSRQWSSCWSRQTRRTT